MGKQMSEKWVRTNLNNAAGSGSKGAMSLVDDLKLNGAPQQGFLPERILNVSNTSGGSALYSLTGSGNQLTATSIGSLAPELQMTLIPEMTFVLGVGARSLDR
jgi:hypothetical protein